MQAKRCGHRPGKEIVSKQEMVDRIKAAVDARTDPQFVIMARTDALAVEGIDRALERAVACVEAGADMIFPEAMTELAMYRRFKDAVKVPILANITEFGHTPLYTRDELGTVGVDIVLYCCSAYRAMNAAALATYQAIRRDGTQKNVLDRMQTRADLVRVSRLPRLRGQVGRVVRRRERKMSEQCPGSAAGAFKPKKSVALSGVAAGNTALCTVGRTGNDLHYRGYDILDIATQCEFEEIAYLLVHEKLPNRAELAAYKTKLEGAASAARGGADGARAAARGQPSDGCAAHRRIGARLLSCPKRTIIRSRARATSPTGCWRASARMLCYWYHFALNGRRIDVQTDDDSIGAHFLHLLHGRKPPASGCARCIPR